MAKDFAKERFGDKQRRKVLENSSTPSTRQKPEEKSIEIVPFEQFYELTENPNDYNYNFVNHLRKNICASENLKECLTTIILNLFAKLPNKIVQPGKEYSRAEREYIKNQLSHYKYDISCLEVALNKSTFKNQNDLVLGMFYKKDRYKTESLLELIDSHVWKDDKKYHLVYLDDPKPIADKRNDRWLSHVIADTIDYKLRTRYGIDSKITEMENLSNEHEKEVFEQLMALNGFDLEEDFGIKETRKAIEIFKQLQNPSPFQKKFLEVSELTYKIWKEGLAEYRNLPSPTSIVEKIISKIEPNGILLFNYKKEVNYEKECEFRSQKQIFVYQKLS